MRDFHRGDTRAVRGWVVLEGARVPFLQLSYRAGPDAELAGSAGQLSETIGCTFAIRDGPPPTV